ncbi:MAG TPA: hypothetical protein VF591_10690 [Pyrinomonadaceae bacterium]
MPFTGGAAREAQRGKQATPKSQADKCLELNRENPTLPCVVNNSTEGGGTQPPPPPAPGSPDGKVIVRSLTGYRSGYFLHPGTLKFCNLLSQDINRLSAAGNKVTVVVTGYADGEKNYGVPAGREKPMPKCSQIARSQVINDEELARLRGCSVWDILSSLLERQGVALFGSRTNQFQDIDDGGPAGDPYRKVVVEVVWQ